MKKKKWFVAAGAMAAVLALVGCTAHGGPAEHANVKRVVVAGQARLDAKTGTAVMPLDKYAGPQDGVISYAKMLFAQGCARAKGYDYHILDGPMPSTQRWTAFGLWDMAEAEKYGFDQPMSAAAAAGKKLGASEPTGTAADAAWTGCLHKAAKRFPVPDVNAQDGPMSLSGEAYWQTRRDDRAKKVFAAYQACARAKGLKVASHGSGPVSVDIDTNTVSEEQQIKIAVESVECKNKHNTVQQLADIDASYQTVLIAKYQSVLNARLKKINATHAAAQKYIAQHG